ncbi:YrhK family protein [Rhodovulum sulfidophilum]|uniref:YrhK family protein n=1 Tax=Rhodovulum sulfidophilum TaxID=35806 RepID=UPI0005AAFD3B|nr:YrhK family protein [Rhodovulum sulfidophilum]ANB32995.1 hypothetical protein A6W98_02215 [Rhodovulum sulfidophilum DSM 1374]ANB36843.1 hypothetical protein A6024_02200 [Rhodovulum sulfidophilum]MCW2302608.1 hypothetical protein [Rhodovulum sulfidophilum]OLS53508.1 hypothetical protein BV392_17005 [Rhodovulum sulfidophilum]
MTGLERTVRVYRHWHLSVAVAGNFLFLVGSVLFLPTFSSWETAGVWMFIVGSFLMLIGAFGEVAKAVYEKHERDRM